MKNFKTMSIVVILFIFLVTGCRDAGSSVGRVELTVSAAASLTDVVQEIGDKFEQQHPDIQLTYNFASSGLLQNQIAQGAPVDLFISAAQKEVETLHNEGKAEYITNLVTNTMVMIVPSEHDQDIQTLRDLTRDHIQRIAIGDPSTVPAGMYAHQVLKQAGIWESVQPKIVFAKDVRQVLAYVESGNVDAGLVYSSDFVAADNVQKVVDIDPSLHQPIIYPGAIVSATTHKKEAELFLTFLQSDTAFRLFEKYGFSPFRQ
ncbi:MAG: molybdate ABC transporter substrate-binding protein [Bacillaceae bacterium]|nr:molybdate ABC transporter substrate-binding protein [Bacillaceae bacterium]